MTVGQTPIDTDQERRSRSPGQFAPRVKKPKLTDPRLIVGTLLVVGSVALGAWAMDEARSNEPVYVAATVLTPGTVLTSAHLSTAEVRLLEQQGLYVTPAWDFTQEYVLTQTISPGEFIPLTALQPQDDTDRRVIAIPLAISPPAEVAVGAVVDLWHSEVKAEQGSAELIAANLIVSEVPSRDGVFTVSSAGQVHVVVPQDDVAAVLSAVQHSGALALLPAPGGIR